MPITLTNWDSDMKKIDIEKFVEKINTIGKLIAFVGIVLSVLIKLNRLFGFWGQKKSNTSEIKSDSDKVG
jgi:hypothetical protein